MEDLAGRIAQTKRWELGIVFVGKYERSFQKVEGSRTSLIGARNPCSAPVEVD